MASLLDTMLLLHQIAVRLPSVCKLSCSSNLIIHATGMLLSAVSMLISPVFPPTQLAGQAWRGGPLQSAV